MSREWKPGDVALVTTEGPHMTWAAAKDGKGWASLDPDIGWAADSDVTEARPLVVIDPEDREQVERLVRLFDGAVINSEPAFVTDEDLRDMQAALREFANPTPPRPDEPRGLGAVVECDPGIYDRSWAVRVWAGDAFGGKAWDWYDSSGNGGRSHYADLAVTKVLSEGVL